MALILKTLEKGTLTGAASTVVYPPTSPPTTFPWPKNVLVKNIILQAVNASTVNIQITDGSAIWNVSPKDMAMVSGEIYAMENELTLNFNVSAPWKVQITLSGGGSPSVKYVINGFERDI